MAKAKKKSGKEIDVPVKFAKVSVGVGAVSIGITIDRSRMSLAQADRVLCGRRLTGKIEVLHEDEDADQTHLLDDMDVLHLVESVFDVKSFRANRKTIGATLSFSIGSSDVKEICEFAERSGRLSVDLIQAVDAANSKTKDDDDEDDKE